MTLSIETMQTLAISKGGKCLSTHYKNNNTKLLWECLSGHQWESVPANVLKGKWCPVCANNNKGSYHRLTLEEMKRIAIARGGLCLSDDYKNNSSNLKWKCGYCQNVWSANASNIKMGKWCPSCTDGLAERICRTTFEQLFGKPFPAAWPTWLINSDGYRMELDGFNQELRLAFEHQGSQHYRYVKHYHRNNDSFELQQRRDIEKRELCIKQNITLIEIPEVLNRLAICEVKPFIISELKKLNNMTIPDELDSKVINYDSVYVPDSHERFLRLHGIVEAHGGELLTSKFISSKTPVQVRCGICNHVWGIRPHNLMSGKWCSKCSKYRVRYSIDDMKATAAAKGGKCLSEQYQGNNKHLLWQCSLGHQWKATPVHIIRSDGWCPICSYKIRADKLRLSLTDMEQIAEAKGGRCLSEKYINASTKLRWQCGTCEFIWDALYSNIKGSPNKKGTWCPRCAGKK